MESSPPPAPPPTRSRERRRDGWVVLECLAVDGVLTACTWMASNASGTYLSLFGNPPFVTPDAVAWYRGLAVIGWVLLVTMLLAGWVHRRAWRPAALFALLLAACCLAFAVPALRPSSPAVETRPPGPAVDCRSGGASLDCPGG